MSFFYQKYSFLFPFFLLVFCSSCKSTTESKYVFSSLSQTVKEKTDQNLYWNTENKEIEEVSQRVLQKRALSMTKAVEIAILNNQSLQAEYERTGIACAAIRQASLLKNPVFQFAYQFTTVSSSPSQIITQIMENFLEIILIPLKKNAAEENLESVKNSILDKVIEIIAKTKIAFYNLQVHAAIVKEKENLLLARELAYDAAVLMREVGNIPLIVVSQKLQEQEMAKLALYSAKIKVVHARQQINTLLGVFGENADLDFEETILDPSTTKRCHKKIEQEAVQNSFFLKGLFNDLKSMAASLKVDTSRLVFPDLALGASAQYQEGIWYVGPQINLPIPIFDIGKVSASSAHYKISHKYKSLLSESVKTRNQAKKILLKYNNLLSQFEIVKNTLLPTAKKVFIETLHRHNAMQMGVFDLLEAKISQIEKKILYLEKINHFFAQSIFLEAVYLGKVFEEEEL